MSLRPSRLAIIVTAMAFTVATLGILLLAMSGVRLEATDRATTPSKTFLGFDRNEYPGNEALPLLRRTFAFAGYWLNSPPGASANSWAGKRDALQAAGFGFLLLFNGRLDAEIKKASNAAELGRSDGEAAVTAARREGFKAGSLIFLDQEEGGRMLPEQKAYIYAWVDAVNGADYRAGIYCSGIAVVEGKIAVVTADDLRENSAGRKIEFWVANDSCPPAPGCSFSSQPPRPSASGIQFASVWQYAQSPRRRDFARGCSNYAADGNCYPPDLHHEKLFVDVDVAGSPDPSGAR